MVFGGTDRIAAAEARQLYVNENALFMEVL